MTSNPESTPSPTQPSGSPHKASPPAGRWVVLTMFSFALIMILLLWGYWEMYTRPFRALQLAIAAQYPGSSPAVIGGEHKSHKGINPKTLRIVVRVTSEDFNPELEPDKSEARARELVTMARDNFDVSPYDQIEVRLIQRVPEKEWLKWSASRPLDEWGIDPAVRPEAAPAN